MSKAVNYDALLKQYQGDGSEAAEAVMFFTNIISRIHRSAFIDGAYQVSEMLTKGDALILQNEPNSKVDEWDISVSVKKNGKVQKLGYLEPFLARKVKVEKYTAEVFEPFKMDNSSFRNYGMQILIRLND